MDFSPFYGLKLTRNSVPLSKILSAFSSKQQVDYDALKKYSIETNVHFYKTFPWAQIRPSVHKLLVHGTDIAQKLKYNKIYFEEDSLEGWHKVQEFPV